MTDTAFLDVASRIAAQLSATATWHEDRCTWIGADNDEGPNEAPIVRYLSLGPDLYSGTSGVALFLARLYTATADADVRRTALGAARHALARIDDLPSGSWAVYAGRSGVLLGAAVAGLSTGDDAVVERVRGHLTPTSLGRSGGEEVFDVISGHAGAVLGLLALAQLLDDPALIDSAARRGDALVAGASRTGEEWSWAAFGRGRSAHLAGYSHGAAGVAHALLELHAVTAHEAFRDGARAAFAYERRLYDPQRRNWPDLREVRRTRKGPAWTAFWCHGAPGIALSRLRAVELDDDVERRREAAAAIETTRNVCVASLAAGGNYSLCHGLAGNGEVLLRASEVLGPSEDASRGVALDVAGRGIERYASRGDWPCGTFEGQTANLLLGLAGIGLFFLRLHDPSVLSVLLLRPEAFRGPKR